MNHYDDMTMPKVLQTEIDKVDKKRILLVALKSNVVLAEKAAQAMKGKYPGEIGISVIWTYSDPSVLLHIPIEKMADSVHMLSYLSAHGLERIGDGVLEKHSGSRKYAYPGMHVYFTPPVDEDGLRPGCRRVIDHYEEYKTPVYKIVCDDEA